MEIVETQKYEIVRVGRQHRNRTYALREGLTRVGRYPEENEIVFSDRTVSRSHAYFIVVRGLCSVSVSDSTNGTFVNGERVKVDKILSVGDLVGFGSPETDVRRINSMPRELVFRVVESVGECTVSDSESDHTIVISSDEE